MITLAQIAENKFVDTDDEEANLRIFHGVNYFNTAF